MLELLKYEKYCKKMNRCKYRPIQINPELVFFVSFYFGLNHPDHENVFSGCLYIEVKE